MKVTSLLLSLFCTAMLSAQIVDENNAATNNSTDNAAFLLHQYEDFIQFDPNKRVFDQETVYVESDFERTYKSKTSQHRIDAESGVAQAGAYVVAKSTLFLFRKGLEALLTPKRDKTEFVSSTSKKTKGIRR